MKLSDFLIIMDQFFANKVESGSLTGRKTMGDKVKTYLGAFIFPIDEDENPLFDLKDDYLRKVFNGSEQLSKENASFISANLDLKTFEDFCDDLIDDSVDAIITLFANHHKVIRKEKFEFDLVNVLRDILYYIVNVSPSASIRKSVFVGPDKIKIGGRTIDLLPELTPTVDILDKELPYVNALLRVYSQAEKFENVSLEDLQKIDPKYEQHFKIQREHYFSAESVLHQIRDIFIDGEKEFILAKNETYSGISSVLLKAYKNALERVDSTMEHVVLITYGKSYLTRPGSGFIGNAEKQGIVHMLVNDGKIEWVVDYDKDI